MHLPANFRLVVLSNRPTFDFQAFQVANERSLSLIEGSALSDSDLSRIQAGRASAHLLLADRFTSDPANEDMSMMFQVRGVDMYVLSDSHLKIDPFAL